MEEMLVLLGLGEGAHKGVWELEGEEGRGRWGKVGEGEMGQGGRGECKQTRQWEQKHCLT